MLGSVCFSPPWVSLAAVCVCVCVCAYNLYLQLSRKRMFMLESQECVSAHVLHIAQGLFSTKQTYGGEVTDPYPLAHPPYSSSPPHATLPPHRTLGSLKAVELRLEPRALKFSIMYSIASL